jgi:hypothetical protein
MLKIIVTSITLITASIVQMPMVTAANLDRPSVYEPASPVIIKNIGQLAQVGGRSGSHQDYSWGTNQTSLPDLDRH